MSVSQNPRSSSTEAAKKISRLVVFFIKKPLTVLAIVALLPILFLILFTFKSGYAPKYHKHKVDSLVVTKMPTEIANEATRLLQKRDLDGFSELLHELGPNINVVNGRGDPLLLVAATLGNLKAVEILLSAGADINARNALSGDTALLRALLHTNNFDLVSSLVVYGADINAVNNYGQSPMSLALEKPSDEAHDYLQDKLVDLFLSRGVSVGLSGEYLLRASGKKNLTGVVAMLKGGVNPDVADAKGNTPLIISSSLGDLQSVKWLLDYRADINAANKAGNTALIYAASYNRLDVVIELLKPQTLQAPLDINAKNKLGQTALYLAASRGYEDVVKRLLAADADPTLAANDGLIPYLVARNNKRQSVLPWFEKSLQEVKNSVIQDDQALARAEGRQLQEEILQPAVTDADIFKAAQTGDIDLARQVLRLNKAVVFNKNKEGATPLLVAVENGHQEMVDLLLKNFARLFESSVKGNVFHIAVQTENLDMLKHLVQQARQEGRLPVMLEFKINMAGQQQLTPLGLAALNCNKEFYDYLISIGARPGTRGTGQSNLLGIVSPVDRMAACKAKPARAKTFKK